jgi:hypothetical protein
VINASALYMVLAVLTGWLDRQERHAVAYLIGSFDAISVVSGSRSPITTDAGWRSGGIG